jgi:hypothetical protein
VNNICFRFSYLKINGLFEYRRYRPKFVTTRCVSVYIRQHRRLSFSMHVVYDGSVQLKICNWLAWNLSMSHYRVWIYSLFISLSVCLSYQWFRLGYTNGTCPIDNQRYFLCPEERGYYILASTFSNTYKISHSADQSDDSIHRQNDFDVVR